MRLIGVKTLNDYKHRHADVTAQLDAWIQEAKDACWQTTHDVKARYPTADFLKRNNIIINLKGNKYRLLFQVDYQRGIVLVKNVGTHAEYDKWRLE